MRHLLSLVGACALTAPVFAQTVYDLAPGGASSIPAEFAALDGNTLLFVADADAVPGPEIMRWTPGLGVEFVTQIGVQSFPQFGDPKWVEYFSLTPAWVGGRKLVFFSGNDGETGREPWVTDGTASGTLRLADIVWSSYSSHPTKFTESGGRMYFAASPDQLNYNLFVSDGTPAGTQNLFAGDPLLSMQTAMTALGDELVFGAEIWLQGWELWKTNGTPGGTLPWLQFPPALAEMRPSELFAFDGGVAIVGYFAATGHELYFGRADGSLSSWDLNPGPAHSQPRDFTLHAGELFFTAEDAGHGRELWKLASGTAAPELVADLAPGPTGSVVMNAIMVSADDGLYVSAENAPTGVGLWRSQGVPGDPVPVTDLTPWPGIVNPKPVAAIGGGILLTAATAGLGRQPYFATAAGIVAVPGWDSSVQMLTLPSTQTPVDRLVGGHLVFKSSSAATGQEMAAFDHGAALSQDLDGSVSGIVLETSDPLLGQTLDVRIDEVPASVLGGALAMSAPVSVLGLPGFALDNGVWLNPAAYQIAKLLPAGASHALAFPIPANPALVGATVHVQSVFLESDYATFLTSNGVRLDLGN